MSNKYIKDVDILSLLTLTLKSSYITLEINDYNDYRGLVIQHTVVL